jgi:hypothetical protein
VIISYTDKRATLRTQIKTQIADAAPFCPPDQRIACFAFWETGADGSRSLVFEKAPPPAPGTPEEATQSDALATAIAAIGALSDENLETRAAELSVRWDRKASRPTMVERVAKASIKAKPAVE